MKFVCRSKEKKKHIYIHRQFPSILNMLSTRTVIKQNPLGILQIVINKMEKLLKMS